MITSFDKALAALIVGVIAYVLTALHVVTLTNDNLAMFTTVVTGIVVYLVPNKA